MVSSSLAQVSGLVGFLLPLLIAVVQQAKWSETTRTVVGIAACAIAAAVTAYFEGNLNLHDWSTSVLVIFTLTKTTYLAVWKPTGVAKKIETKTSPA